MSQENVDIVRRVYEAWNRRDYSRALGLIDSEIEVEAATGGLGDGTYRGRAGLYKALEGFWSEFDDTRVEVEEYVPAGDHVITSVLLHGRGKRGGTSVEWRQWQVWTLRDGKAVRWRLFGNRREAVDAVGLAE